MKKRMIRGAAVSSGGGGSIYATLDSSLGKGMDIIAQCLEQAKASGWTELPTAIGWYICAVLIAIGLTLVVVVGGHLYLPWWQEVTLSRTAFESGLVVAWCVVHGTRTVSFLGMVQLTGRKLALLTLGLGLVGFAMSRSGQAMASLVGMGVGWAFAWRGRFRPQPTPRRSRLHAMSSPRLRVLDGGRDDLPN